MPASKNVSEILWLCSGQLVTMALGIVSIKLLTSMGPHEYGKYALVLTISALLSAILYGPVEQGIVRFYFEYANKGLSKTYLKLFYKFLIIAGMLCLLIMVLTVLCLEIIQSNYRSSDVFVVGIFVIITVSSTPFNSLFNLLRKRKLNTVIQVVERCLTLALVFAVFSYSQLTTQKVLFALFIGTSIIVAMKVIILTKMVPFDTETDSSVIVNSRIEIVKVVKKFSVPFCIWGITGWLQLNSERWVIANYLTTADVGIYAVTLSVANYIIAIPCGIIGQFITPIIYKKYLTPDETPQTIDWQHVLRYYVLSTIALVTVSLLVTMTFGRNILMLLSDNKFVEYWYILPIICFGTGLFYIGQSLTTIGMLLNMPDKYLVPKIATGILAVLVNIIFIKYFGMLGVSLSVCVLGVIFLVLILYANTKINTVKSLNVTTE